MHQFLLSHLIPQVATARPDAIAAVCDDRRLTWAELDGRVGRLAAALDQLSVTSGDRVGVYLHKSLESLVAVHGVLRAGAAYVPIDPMAPVELVASIIADCGIEVLVTHEHRRAGIERCDSPSGLRAVIGLDRPIENGLTAPQGTTPRPVEPITMSWADVAGMDPTDPTAVAADDLAYVMYTSGSTGPPKGIMHTHRSGLRYARMAADLYQLGPNDRVANFSPLHFDMSTFEIFAGVAAGSRVVLVPEQHLRLPASLTQYLADEACTTLYTVPSLFQQMMYRGGLETRDRSAVRWVLPAGEVFPPEALRELMALYPDARFSNVYGPAEVNQCTWYHFGFNPGGPDPVFDGEDTALPIGFGCPGVDLEIIGDDGTPVDTPQRGELIVRTETMMAGYWGRPDLDERAIIDRWSPDGEHQRWYRTGDIVSGTERGELLFHGRFDNQVKIRGHRVELESVEAAVGGLPEVEQTVVGVRPGTAGAHELVASVVLGRTSIDASGWRRSLALQLPSYAIPSVFEEVSGFPLTPSGKIDRRRVRLAIETGDET